MGLSKKEEAAGSLNDPVTVDDSSDEESAAQKPAKRAKLEKDTEYSSTVKFTGTRSFACYSWWNPMRNALNFCKTVNATARKRYTRSAFNEMGHFILHFSTRSP